MKFQFKIQPYQTEAVKAICDVFGGQGLHKGFQYRRDLGTLEAPTNVQMSFEIVNKT